MRVFILLLLFGFQTINFTYAQEDSIPLSVDYATFKAKSNKNYVEIYVAFYQQYLTYQKEESLLVAHFTHTVRVSKDDSVVSEITRNYKSSIVENEVVYGYSQFVDLFPYELPSGRYDVNVEIRDQISESTGKSIVEISVPEYASDLSMSDIELATKISKAEKSSNFNIKNNIEIYPNPSRIYNIVQPILYFYFEAYNLTLDSDGKNKYSYHYYISDTEGNQIRGFPEKIKSTDTTTIAEASGINIISLSPDKYILNIEMTDLISERSASRQVELILDKPQKKAVQTGSVFAVSSYSDYITKSEEELKDEFEKVKYIALSQEKNIFKELDLEGMRRFMAQFWQRRDPNSETPINEYKQAYLENVEIANAIYSTHFKEGWRTDRGRVLLVYGKPDEIERNPSSIDTQPYEIWYYYSLEGGVEFIFGDISGHGSYDLLHSTYRNEISDPNWRSRIGGTRDFGEY